MSTVVDDRKVSRHFPPNVVDRLRAAAVSARWDVCSQIDAITDDLVRQGLCRSRKDASRAGEWARRRAESCVAAMAWGSDGR